MTIRLPDLPYDANALEPYISAETLKFHHGAHHKAYVDKVNALVEGTALARLSLDELVREAAARGATPGLFNNAAQAWNHDFYWHSMRPQGGGRPTGEIAERIETGFGSYDKFVDAFRSAATGQFGSGWAWLVLDEQGRLDVTATSNAETPLTRGRVPLLTIDVWEHAYYIDYRSRRPDYVGAFLDRLLNWDFASRNLARSHGDRVKANGEFDHRTGIAAAERKAGGAPRQAKSRGAKVDGRPVIG